MVLFSPTMLSLFSGWPKSFMTRDLVICLIWDLVQTVILRMFVDGRTDGRVGIRQLLRVVVVGLQGERLLAVEG